MTNTLQTLGEKRKNMNETYDQYLVDMIEGKPLDLSQESIYHMHRELFTLEQGIFAMAGNQTINSYEKEITTLSSLLHKCENSLDKLKPGTSQHTLLTNRIHALRVAIDLMKN